MVKAEHQRPAGLLQPLKIFDTLTYTKYPIKILDTLTRVTRSKVIKMCKVQWSHYGEDEATWKEKNYE
jgi:hypothetical protein